MNSQKRKLDAIIRDLKKDNQVLAVFLFGSTAREENHNKSDIDVCLVLKAGRYTTKELSRKKLEYLKLYDFDIQVFQQLPIYIKKRIIKEGKILFCREEAALYEIAFSVIREFADFECIYRDYLKEVANAG
ncbi:MAG: nucleotidyltransferase domain-containing protein [Candidatus Omnitrophica bacterium]|nr:nucleotidyltransferase domain-containing protein [Candidatus Omnitrophota bacterium]